MLSKYLLLSFFLLLLVGCSTEPSITNEKQAQKETQKIADDIADASATAEELETLSKDLEKLLE
ncbi:hypothetical protein COV18_01125 [Candidatus Woesearchaeota archaeon CG10_big_fil_rev_8_21_14_0_10_37_12]|nr:MAG: hypothetical protein COV18_01125 [Candidatus Woesearchaeota archaeon CG10_big_fil_rev_8_21_14_0_10_37_12]